MMRGLNRRRQRGVVKRTTLMFSDDFFQKGLIGDLLPRMEDVMQELGRTGKLNEEKFNDIVARAVAKMGGDLNLRDHIFQLTPGVEVELLSSSPPSPPRFAEYVAILTVNGEHADGLVGDLDEQFQADYAQFGSARAARRYRARVLRSLWPLLRASIRRMIQWGAILATVKRLFVG